MPLAKYHRFGDLCRFSAPTIATMLFMSLYSMVDGVFVARFVGTDALSAVNLIMPAVNVGYRPIYRYYGARA